MTQLERIPGNPDSERRRLERQTQVLHRTIDLDTGENISGPLLEATRGKYLISINGSQQARRKAEQDAAEFESKWEAMVDDENLHFGLSESEVRGIEAWIKGQEAVNRDLDEYEEDNGYYDTDIVVNIDTIVNFGPPAAGKTQTSSDIIQVAEFMHRSIIKDMHSSYLGEAQARFGRTIEWEKDESGVQTWNRVSKIMSLGIEVTKRTKARFGSSTFFDTLDLYIKLAEDAWGRNHEWDHEKWSYLADKAVEKIEREFVFDREYGNTLHVIEMPALRGAGRDGRNRFDTTLRKLARETNRTEREEGLSRCTTMFVGHVPDPETQEFAANLRFEVSKPDHRRDAIAYLRSQGVHILGLEDTPENNLLVQESFAVRTASKEIIERMNEELVIWAENAAVHDRSYRKYIPRKLPQTISSNPQYRNIATYLGYQMRRILGLHPKLGFVAYAPRVKDEPVFIVPNTLGISSEETS
jgi:hypothetical protein